MSEHTDNRQQGLLTRRALLGAGTAAGISAYAGCLGAGSEDGDLTVALSWDVTAEWTLEPYGGVAPYFTNVFETLTRPTPDLEIEPGWRQSGSSSTT